MYALFRLVKAALPHLHTGSSILHTSSVEACQPEPGLFVHAATKAATVTMTTSPAIDLADKGIRVNTVAPGRV